MDIPPPLTPTTYESTRKHTPTPPSLLPASTWISASLLSSPLLTSSPDSEGSQLWRFGALAKLHRANSGENSLHTHKHTHICMEWCHISDKRLSPTPSQLCWLKLWSRCSLDRRAACYLLLRPINPPETPFLYKEVICLNRINELTHAHL